MIAKYSAGPNWSATRIRGRASSMRSTTLTVPATKDPIAAIPSAGPARPCRVIW